jgi:hypothetical protein
MVYWPIVMQFTEDNDTQQTMDLKPQLEQDPSPIIVFLTLGDQ